MAERKAPARASEIPPIQVYAPSVPMKFFLDSASGEAVFDLLPLPFVESCSDNALPPVTHCTETKPFHRNSSHGAPFRTKATTSTPVAVLHDGAD